MGNQKLSCFLIHRFLKAVDEKKISVRTVFGIALTHAGIERPGNADPLLLAAGDGRAHFACVPFDFTRVFFKILLQTGQFHHLIQPFL